MADAAGQGQGQAAGAPAPAAAQGGTDTGPGPMMGELQPFSDDPSLGGQEDLIMQTFFGGQSQNSSAGDQGSGATAGSTPAGDQSGVAAPSPGASVAATGASGEPQELPPVPVPGTTPSQQQPQQPAGATQQLPQQPQGQQPSGPASAPAAATPGGPQAAPADPTAGWPPEARLLLQSLQAQVQALQGQHTQTQAPSTGQQQPGGGVQQPQRPAEQETISLVVPPDVMQAVFDEDPTRAAAGLNHLISATATMTYQRTMQAVQGLIDNRLAGYQQQTTEQQRAEREWNEYVGDFPTHSNELIAPLVRQEAQAMWGEMPHLPWTKESRAALGQRVNAKLQALGFPVGIQPGGQQQPQQQEGTLPPVVDNRQQQPATQRPAPMMGASTRAAASGGGEDFITRTLG